MYLTQCACKHLPGSYVMRWGVVRTERGLCVALDGVVRSLRYKRTGILIAVTECIVFSAFVGGYIDSYFISCLTMIK
jgi:hypothetical protein